MRPSTQGCTEWTCMYHGDMNRWKSEHAEGCPVRASTAVYYQDLPTCTCGVGTGLEELRKSE